MKKLLLLICLFPIASFAEANLSLARDEDNKIITVSSPENRVAVLELYTSEGCSSCPPADRFLSRLKDSGISDRQLIPMAFHVTYWDYIGWKDRFANKKFDQRQRELAYKKNSTSVYTPQFVLSGDDYRQYAHFSDDVNKLVNQEATVDLLLSAHVEKNAGAEDVLQMTVKTDTSKTTMKKTGFYFVILEDNLVSNVSDGENEGEQLHHDYVVRQMYGPYFRDKSNSQKQVKQRITIKPEWKKQDLSIVVFAENPVTGEVLQAVRLDQI